MSQTLYEIDAALQQVLENDFVIDYETGEVLFDDTDLEMLEMARDQKLESCALVIKNQKALIESLKQEEKNLKARRAVLENKNKRLIQYVQDHMNTVPNNRLETSKCVLSLRKSHAVEVIDETKLPEAFVKHVTKDVPDKKAIADAFKAGDMVEGAAYLEKSSLQIK